MNDIKDILGSTGIAASSKKSSKYKSKVAVEKCPEGMSKEVFRLVGGRLPSLAPAAPLLVKEKPNLGKSAVSWIWKPFKNSARADGLTLCHWAKADDPDEDYAFSKLSQPLNIINYTDAEYQVHLQQDDWTREETDYLFELCKTYDLRFLIIADRYDYAGTSRSIEDLKERYYSVTRKILFARNPMADPNQKADIAMLHYDKAKDLERKTYIERLSQRSWEEIKEEEMLVIEARRIEQNRKKLERDRENLLRLLNADYFGHPSLVQILSGDVTPAGGATDSKLKRPSSKKKKETPAVPAPAAVDTTTATAAAAAASTTTTKKVLKKGEEVTMASSQKKEKKVSGVYVRSQMIVPIKSLSIQQKVNSILEELGVTPIPKMPTEKVCKHFEELLQSISTLLEIKKQTDKLEQELKVLQNRKAALLGEPVPSPSDASSSKKRTLPSPIPRPESKRARK